MILVVDVLPNWVSLEDANHSHHRLKKHLFVFLAVLVGLSTSGFVHGVEMSRTTSGRELEQLKRSVAVGHRTEKSSSIPPPSMESNLVESLFRSGFYSATFDRICQKQTSRHLVTGSSGSPAAAELTSEDRPHSTGVHSSDPSSGVASVRVRRSSARREKARWHEILRSNECRKINATNTKRNDSRSMAAAKKNIADVNKRCADEVDNLGCYPIPQVVHLADLCNQLPLIDGVTNMRTIVHACPDISCCVAGHRCQVKHFAKVNKSFMVEDGTITIQFRNHTECACAYPGLKSTST